MTPQPLLKDWVIRPGQRNYVSRFPQSEFPCPECRKYLLEDNWPPNYGGGSGGGGQWQSHSSLKCVCLNCKICVRLFITEASNSPRQVKYSDTVALVQHGDVWLTPHDVFREEYKEKHGEYPEEVYA